jgi:hypothetical protein
MIDTAICKEVIVAMIERRGKGVEHSPIRIITQVFEKDGTLIAEYDPFDETFCAMDLVHFARWCIENKFQVQNVKPNDVNKWLDSIKDNKNKVGQ